MFARELEYPVFLGMHFRFLGEQHMQPGVHQKGSQQVHHPGKVLDKFRAKRDHESAHDQRSDHTPLQQPVLEAPFHCKRPKNHQEKKQIVDAQGFFNQVARKILKRRLFTVVMEDRQSEQHRNGNPAEACNRSLSRTDAVRLAVEHPQIQHDRNNDEDIERNPV